MEASEEGCLVVQLPTLAADSSSWDCAIESNRLPYSAICVSRCSAGDGAGAVRCADDGRWRIYTLEGAAPGDWTTASSGAVVSLDPCTEFEIVGDDYTPTWLVVAIYGLLAVLVGALGVIYCRFQERDRRAHRFSEELIGDKRISQQGAYRASIVASGPSVDDPAPPPPEVVPRNPFVEKVASDLKDDGPKDCRCACWPARETPLDVNENAREEESPEPLHSARDLLGVDESKKSRQRLSSPEREAQVQIEEMPAGCGSTLATGVCCSPYSSK
eukprot:gnl/TRDRNA2_/TRDRNA2_196564_c0_seq1.p1 gnl/TRDRNA2_/TRDRNA2_196564_c0~~gnl/TRDRNA2_/TRDRNA2_196564_c0_seq1.p1  ORF type:complete len:308 (+),score=39.66 gnl/TRDRNA2_/TRDRNA2_196564_c0_seq1:108-926(+)